MNGVVRSDPGLQCPAEGSQPFRPASPRSETSEWETRWKELGEDLAECVDAAHAAALGTGTWENMLERMARAFPGTKIAITSKQLQPFRNIGLVTHGYEPDAVRDYEEYYSASTPGPRAGKTSRRSPRRQQTMFFRRLSSKRPNSTRSLQKSVMPSASGVKLFEDCNSRATLSLHYSTRQAEKYNAAIPRFLDALTPHLKLAIQLSARMAELSEPTPTLERAVQQFQSAAFLIDHSGTLLDTNSSGRDLLAEGQAARLQSEHLWIADDVARSRLDSIAQTEGPRPQVDIEASSAWRLFEFNSTVQDRRVAWMPERKRWILASEPAVGRPSIAKRSQSFGLTRQKPGWRPRWWMASASMLSRNRSNLERHCPAAHQGDLRQDRHAPSSRADCEARQLCAIGLQPPQSALARSISPLPDEWTTDGSAGVVDAIPRWHRPFSDLHPRRRLFCQSRRTSVDLRGSATAHTMGGRSEDLSSRWTAPITHLRGSLTRSLQSCAGPHRLRDRVDSRASSATTALARFPCAASRHSA